MTRKEKVKEAFSNAIDELNEKDLIALCSGAITIKTDFAIVHDRHGVTDAWIDILYLYGDGYDFESGGWEFGKEGNVSEGNSAGPLARLDTWDRDRVPMDGSDHLGNGTMIAQVNAWQQAELDRRIAEYQAEKDNLVEK